MFRGHRLQLLTAASVIASVIAVGVLADRDSSTTPPDDEIQLLAGLVSFTSCDDVLSYLKTQALTQVGPYGLNGGPMYAVDTLGGVVAPQAGAADGAAESTAGGDRSADFSSTTVQEAGVDEPDVIKTDGKLIITANDGVFRVIDAATMRQLGSIDLRPPAPETSGAAGDGAVAPDVMIYPGYVDATLLLDGDRALVLVQGYSMLAAYDGVKGDAVTPEMYQEPQTRLVSIDLSAAAEPRIVASLMIDGDILAARMIDGVARVAVRPHVGIEFPYDESTDNDPDAATQRNREIIESSTLADWLPAAHWINGNADPSAVTGDPVELAPCERIARPRDFSGLSALSVLTLPLDGDLHATDGTAVVGSGDTVYASADRLYVTSTEWPAVNLPGAIVDGVRGAIGAPDEAASAPMAAPPVYTSVHAFDIASDGPAAYIGSGRVPGSTIGSYAMSEYNHDLRIATTTNTWTENSQSDSRVSVLAERDGALEVVGTVSGLGKGEQIYAVRYAGPIGFVVTYQQVDPLYVIDLSDPTAPAVTGELKVTGASTYLQPLDDDRVLGIGLAATDEGRRTGAQASLFDVSDTSAPALLDRVRTPDGWSDAEYDPHAFLYWAPTGAVVLPMWANNKAGGLVLHLSGDTLTNAGWITASDDVRGDEAAYGPAALQRSLVIGDTLFTLWPTGLQANALDDLAVEGSLTFA